MSAFPGRVEHSKTYRTPRAYTDQRVLLIGNSASGHDIATMVLKSGLAQSPLYVSRHSRSRWDGDYPPEGVVWKPVISEYKRDGTIVFTDGSTLRNVDKVVYCTGYKASYPFWNEKANGRPLYDYENDYLINNYQHTFVHDFPTLAFVGLPRVLTFRSFEYQAIAIARLWAGRSAQSLPPVKEQQSWLRNRLDCTTNAKRRFHQIEWESDETMDWFRYLFELAGLPLIEGFGRCPPVLGSETRWAIEHIKKYPEKHPPKSKADEEWEIVEEKDALHFI